MGHERFPLHYHVRSLFCWLLLVVLLAATPAAWAQQRVISIGDVHGNYQGFTAILREAGLIDADHRWSGGNAILVQTGDFLNRGPEARAVLDLMMALQKEAPQSGGRVAVLLGNHEVMNMIGDLRYVSDSDYASFADDASESRRKAAYRDYVRWEQQRARRLRLPAPEITHQTERRWMAERPLGFLEMREALSTRGDYGIWLRRLPAIAKFNDVIFLHGGISPEIMVLSIDELNLRIREEIRGFDDTFEHLVQQRIVLPFFDLTETLRAVREELERGSPRDRQLLENFLGLGRWLSINALGPLWFRGFDHWTEEEGRPHVEEALRRYRASHFVAAHTPQIDGRIRPRFDNRVFLIDTGMLATHYRGGLASALEIKDGEFTAIYLDTRIVLVPPPGEGAPVSAAVNQPRELPGGGLAEAGSLYPAPQEEAAQEEASKPAEAPRRVWIGPNGQPLPFKNDEEIMAFLRDAEIVRARHLSTGTTAPRQVLLRKDGIEMNGIFRDVDERRTMHLREMHFRDSYSFEPAAYEVAQMLGLDNVPPAVNRRYRRTQGSVQIWLEGGMTEDGRLRKKINPPDSISWSQQIQTMRMFDNLVFNVDRNQGNILIGPDWKVWFIDHTRAFRRSPDLRETGNLNQVERRVLQKLREFDADEAQRRLAPYIEKPEIDGVIARARKLVEFFDGLIAARGEESVVFDQRPYAGVQAMQAEPQ